VTDFDHGVNFNQYRTFGWGTADLSFNNPIYRGDLISKRIKSTIENELAKRGVEYNASNPDFVVSYQTFTEKVQHNYYNGGGLYGPFSPFGYRFYPYGFGYGFSPYGYGPSYPSSYTETYGTLIIDIADKRTGAVVWRGSVKGPVDNLKNLQRQIDKGVMAIMKKYPLPAGGHIPLNEKGRIS
jgi:hypothetical protein